MLNPLVMLLILICLTQASFITEDSEPQYDSILQEEKLIIEEPSNSATVTAENRVSNKEVIYQIADDFYAQSVSGNYMHLYGIKDKPVVVCFWAPYDRYSVKTLNGLMDIKKKYRKKNVEVLAVAIHDLEDTRKFIGKNPQYTSIIYIGQRNMARDYGIWGLPTTYVLDATLGIRKVFSGYVPKKDIEKELKKVLRRNPLHSK